ncbi:hypothetical protein GCM10025868_24740 [Angustibacter aerolatus]|uniref:UvrD-like helicase ATP-binding domain-containing protein n=1 Tax=Angustibacter aerolatus TaxID=1162965 RepID=A0ABQ6JHD3_9ACTN|nr:hypothetical protein GCM10025868_24740 [Angustibacter aerolatus]
MRKHRLHLVDYDDLLRRLADALRDPVTGLGARERLAARYPVVLVDEFQDTDPVQWQILRDAFHERATLVLIGDPKQAIYGFRGADVHAYLAAREAAGTRSTLPTNHRSDAALLAGLDALVGGLALGDERIRVTPVAAAHPGRLVTPGAPVRLRVLPRDGLPLSNEGLARVDRARAAVADDLAVEVVEPAAAAGGARARRRRATPAARRRRGAGAHQPAGPEGAHGARGGRRPRGADHPQQRVRHAGGR